MSQMSDGTKLIVQGRIVWVSGDIFAGSVVTDYNTKQPVLDAEGNQKREWSLGIAVPKGQLTNDPTNIWGAIHAEAAKLYPQGLPGDFAMKYKDGDTNDNKGQPYANRTGYAGHMVFALSTRIKPSFFVWDATQNDNILINQGIKCGDYVNVQMEVKAHGPVGRGKAGLYMNMYAVQLVGEGEAIINTPTGSSIFGAQAPQVPTGAQAPAAPAMPAMGAPTAQAAIPASPAIPAAPAQAAPAPAPAAQPAAPVAQPHHGVLPPQHQPEAPQAPTPQPAAAPAPAGMPMPPGFGQQ